MSDFLENEELLFISYRYLGIKIFNIHSTQKLGSMLINDNGISLFVTNESNENSWYWTDKNMEDKICVYNTDEKGIITILERNSKERKEYLSMYKSHKLAFSSIFQPKQHKDFLLEFERKKKLHASKQNIKLLKSKNEI